MRKIAASDVMLKALGLLLLTAVVLKGHELLTVPVANKDLFSWRSLPVFQVEFELAMAIWLLSGMFRWLAWLAALACLSLFCCVTLCKGNTDAASCGCHGIVNTYAWITPLAVGLPAMILLWIPCPRGVFASLGCSWSFAARMLRMFWRTGYKVIRCSYSHAGAILDRAAAGTASVRVPVTAVVVIVISGATTPILSVNEPPRAPAKYEILTPETWVGQKLPISKYIDVGRDVKQGKWLLIMYRSDCLSYKGLLSGYIKSAASLSLVPGTCQIGFVDIAPETEKNVEKLVSPQPYCSTGRLRPDYQWLMVTPVVIKTDEGVVTDVTYKDRLDLLPTSDKPLIVAHPPTIDFGEIPYEDSKKAELAIENISGSPVHIQVFSACGCTRVILDYPWVLPDCGTLMYIHFTPARSKRPAPQEERITIVVATASAKQTLAIPIKANVIRTSQESDAASEPQRGGEH